MGDLAERIAALEARQTLLERRVNDIKEACDTAALASAETAASQADALARVMQRLQNARMADPRIIV
jgi:hypothetical protein